ncbi:MAG TPA: single-stranded DNA-binding protein [Methanosarcinales archaeon]|nr:single-stranded DNA-binding protein [Methanosarcinales archaeon]
MSFNKVILQGNIVRDPEIKAAGSSQVCKFTLAISHKYKEVEEVIFMDIAVWGPQADACSKWLKKGSSALVSGRLKQESWKAQTGEERSKFVVVAEQVVFLNSKSDSAPMPLRKEHIKSMDPNTGQALMDFDALPF